MARRLKIDEKVFCVGFPKTGTTSLELALKDLGFKLGNQRGGEVLLDDWAQRTFDPIIEFCRSAEAFQDVPFCLPFTFQALDQAFAGAKFVLSVRNSTDEWYRSIVRFHSSLWADGIRTPEKEDLAEAFYVEKGGPLRVHKTMFAVGDEALYDKDTLCGHYDHHCSAVREYFRHRPGKLLEVNVGCSEDYLRFCEFLGRRPVADSFPWLNRSST